MDAADPMMGTGRIGVVGVGRMGAPIARALQRSFAIAVHDTDPGRMRAIEGDGIERCDSVEDLAGSCGVLVTVLPGPRDLDVVARSALPLLQAGSLWIDCTSGSPATTMSLAQDAAVWGVQVVSAPMGGSPAEAAATELGFFVSGADMAVERAIPILEHLAAVDRIRRVGDRVEDGQIVKLLANALWFANAAAASEAMLIGAKLGIPTEHLHRLLRVSAGSSRFLEHDADRLLDGDYLTTFGIDRVVEELDTVASLRADSGVDSPVLDASAALHRAALDRYGDALGELLAVRLLEERAHQQLRR
ncbi:NAD-binding protein [Curtobacterium sp. TC1]|jgi:3-hydroxyisobutyrate dehydrogenase-like beta-hydroxyacid dehydrogenase|uniref:NAD(P)-dependent oxidoreductase n=1 Tax=Curtobacterium sp. TC1 TaxID=2862880 RepID=UPI001C9A4067|nr:NAD(P)-binding domain-containing protein [Curtobacterium sp. TC1]QZQ55568.1 NAD-binding protein [Curtobacterium sp. TC1]